MKTNRKTPVRRNPGKPKADKVIRRADSMGKRAQVKLKPSAPPTETAGDQVARLLERISDGFVAFDAQMNYTYVNARGGELLGRTPEDLIGKNYWMEYPEAEGTPFANAYVRALKEQTPLQIEDYYEPFDRWFENRIHPSKDGLSIFFSEITERKKTELALQEQERLISAIAATSPALIYVYDMGTQSNVYSNAGIEQLLGFSPKEVQAMGADLFIRLIHPDDLPHVVDFQSRLMAAADAEILEIEYRMKDRDGGWHTLHSFERPFVRHADGALKQKLGVAVDITERKRAEHEIQEHQRQLSTLISNLPGLAYRSRNDANYTTEFVSDGVADLTGYPAEDFREHRREFGQLIHPDDQEQLWAKIQTALKEKRQYELTYRFLPATGGEKWFWEKGQGILDAHGEVEALEGFVTDITERKRAEEELRAIYRASQRLQKLYAPDTLARELIAILESELGFEFGAVLLVDEARGGLTPFALSEQGRGPDFAALDEAYIASHQITVGQGLTGWVAQTGQSLRLGDVRQDPRYLAVRADIRSELCVPLLAGERILGVVNVESPRPNAYNESDQRVLETVAAQMAVAIQNAQLLEQIQRHATELEGRVAERTAELKEQYQRQATLEERQRLARDLHDVVSQTLFSASVIAETLPRLWQRDPEQVRQGLGELHRLTRGALAEMRSLLLELRPEAMTEINLADLLGHLVNALSGRSHLEVSLTAEPVPALPPEARVGLYRLAQEALNNVVKHARAQRVEIALTPITVGEAHGVQLRLRDDGRGFDPASVPPGHLGLGIMRERAEAIGASIIFQTQPGAGTEVRVTWPKLATDDRFA